MVERNSGFIHTAVERSIAVTLELPLPPALQQAQQICAANPLESEIAEAAAFLAASGALMINGRCLSVCGQNFVGV